MNIQNTSLAVSSAITVLLADGDDHAGALPHLHRFFLFIKAVKAGVAKLRVRGIPRRLVLICSADSVALFEQTNHCSALATYPFPQGSTHKDQKNQLLVLIPHTHTTKSQEDMWKLTHKPYEATHGESYCVLLLLLAVRTRTTCILCIVHCTATAADALSRTHRSRAAASPLFCRAVASARR